MTRKASPEVIECFVAFLTRNTSLSEGAIRDRLKDALTRASDSELSVQAFGRAHVRRPADVRPAASNASKPGSPIPTRSTKRVDDAKPGSGTASDASKAAALRAHYPVNAVAPIAFPEHALEAVDATPDDVRTRLAGFIDYIAARVEARELPCVDVPDLHQANSIYDERGNVFLGDKSRRLALDRRGGKAFMRLLLTVEAASANLRDGVCTTKRGLYYHHQARLPDAAPSQLDSDRALAALANLLGVRRRALGFVEARRGLVYGHLVLRDGDAVVDVSKLGGGGVAPPRFTDDVEIVNSDAAFILVVEKHSIGLKLAQARWWETTRCIMVCSEGFPSVSTREFVRSLAETLGIPAFVCADADPSGIRLALTLAHGSISTALETPWLACNDVWWAGVCPSDIDYSRLEYLIRFANSDFEAARQLLEHPSTAYVSKGIRDEIALLVEHKSKLEVDALVNDMSRFDGYLRKKLFDSELLKL